MRRLSGEQTKTKEGGGDEAHGSGSELPPRRSRKFSRRGKPFVSTVNDGLEQKDGGGYSTVSSRASAWDPTRTRMSSPPFFSVGIPVYNGAAFLETAVRSVRSQTCADWELVIIDDASRDGTAGLAQCLAAEDPRIRVLVNEVNLGQAGNLNRCLAVATGRWVGFLPADDAYRPELLASIQSVVDGSDDVDLWIHRHSCFGDGIPAHDVPVRWPEGEFPLRELARCFWLRGNIFGELSSFFVRRASLEDGGLKFGPSCLTLDARLWMQLALARPDRTFFLSQKVLADVLLHAASGTSEFARTGANVLDFYDFVASYAGQGWAPGDRLWQAARLLKSGVTFRRSLNATILPAAARALRRSLFP